MSFGLKQDENGRLYVQELVDTDGGRKAGTLIRVPYYKNNGAVPPLSFKEFEEKGIES